MRRTLIALALIVLVLVLLAATGHLLVFTTPPVQICVGWPDDTVFSWWCTPDYTARPPVAFTSDPAFWRMLTPAGRRVLAAVTVVATDKPCEILPGHPYLGGVYQGDANTIMLCGEATQSNPNILRHEALHALDVADGHSASEDCCFTKLAMGQVGHEAEAIYEAGGAHFELGELYAMTPLVVDWHFDELPSVLAAYYAEWFTDAQ